MIISTYFFLTGAVICVLRIGDILPYWSLYFYNEINNSVLGYILLYWCIFFSHKDFNLLPEILNSGMLKLTQWC